MTTSCSTFYLTGNPENGLTMLKEQNKHNKNKNCPVPGLGAGVCTHVYRSETPMSIQKRKKEKEKYPTVISSLNCLVDCKLMHLCTIVEKLMLAKVVYLCILDFLWIGDAKESFYIGPLVDNATENDLNQWPSRGEQLVYLGRNLNSLINFMTNHYSFW